MKSLMACARAELHEINLRPLGEVGGLSVRGSEAETTTGFDPPGFQAAAVDDASPCPPSTFTLQRAHRRRQRRQTQCRSSPRSPTARARRCAASPRPRTCSRPSSAPTPPPSSPAGPPARSPTVKSPSLPLVYPPLLTTRPPSPALGAMAPRPRRRRRRTASGRPRASSPTRSSPPSARSRPARPWSACPRPARRRRRRRWPPSARARLSSSSAT
jgi:hypothetical protein